MVEKRLDYIESKQGKLEERVSCVEVTQSGLVEAVKGVKESIDKLAGDITWTSRALLGVAIGGVILSFVKDLL